MIKRKLELLSINEMFSRGAAAAAVAGNCSPRYVCPLCLQSHITLDRKKLSREHVPAESLGGKSLLLTCYECNNKAGSRLQGHQVERERVEAFWRGDGGDKLNFEVHSTVGTIRGEIESSGNDKKFIVDSSRTAPNVVENWWPIDESIKYTLGRGFDWKASRVADLRDAYLWVFAQYGYSLIATPFYEWIREAIRTGANSNMKWAINLNDTFTSEQQKIHRTPIILVTSEPKGALVVAHGTRGAILPTLHCPNPYAELGEKEARITFLPKVIPVPDVLKLTWDQLPRGAK